MADHQTWKHGKPPHSPTELGGAAWRAKQEQAREETSRRTRVLRHEQLWHNGPIGTGSKRRRVTAARSTAHDPLTSDIKHAVPHKYIADEETDEASRHHKVRDDAPPASRGQPRQTSWEWPAGSG
jgi:hypothetical protein